MKTALPEYSVRVSPKAKNLRIKVTREDGLCVVVPRDFDEKKIPALLTRKRVWIADAMERIGETRRFMEAHRVGHLPDSLQLTALGETWPIVYRQDTRTGVWVRAMSGTLVLSGDDLSQERATRKLRQWLRLRVRDGLFPVAMALADKHRLPVRRLLVKSQRTRWASCSARKNLSLNTKLLFLSPELVRYVVVHELCHTIHMNHSREFWRLLERHEPSFKALDQRLREAWKALPRWVL